MPPTSIFAAATILSTVATIFAGGQVVAVLLLARRAAAVLPDLATGVYAGAGGALAFLGAGVVAAVADVHRPLAGVYVGVGVALVVRLVMARRGGVVA